MNCIAYFRFVIRLHHCYNLAIDKLHLIIVGILYPPIVYGGYNEGEEDIVDYSI